MSGKLPSFFKETIGAMLNLCLTVYFAAPKELYKFSLVTILTLDGFGRPSKTISVTP